MYLVSRGILLHRLLCKLCMLLSIDVVSGGDKLRSLKSYDSHPGSWRTVSGTNRGHRGPSRNRPKPCSCSGVRWWEELKPQVACYKTVISFYILTSGAGCVSDDCDSISEFQSSAASHSHEVQYETWRDRREVPSLTS